MGRTFRNYRNDQIRNKRFDKIAKSQMRKDRENFHNSKDDERIRNNNKRGILEKFRKRNDPDVIRERIAKKKLKLSEQQIDTKQKLDKAKRPKPSWLQPQESSSKRGGRGRSGGRSRSSSQVQQSDSILDSSPGTGLSDMFGFSSSTTTKKKSDGIDGLTSLFG